MNTFNSFSAWVSWRMFLLGNVLARLFRFSGIARQEVHEVESVHANGTGYERQKSRAFYDHLTRIDSDAFARNDIFFILFLVAGAYLIAGYLSWIDPTNNAALYYAAWIAAAVGLLGLLWAVFIRKPRQWPVSVDEYETHNDLMKTIGVTARQPLGLPGRILVFLMLLVDAAMIAIVALDYAADLPRNIQFIGGILVGVVFAFCLVWLTHHTGEQLYRSGHHSKLVSIIRDERMQSDAGEDSVTFDKIRAHSIPFLVQDKGFWGRFGWLVLTMAFILTIVGLATYARYNQNENLLLAEVRGTLFREWTPQSSPELRSNSQHQDNIAALSDQRRAAQEKAMIAGISILAIVFIAIQVVAIMMAYKHSFALDGGEDLNAYNRIQQYQAQVLDTKQGDFRLTRSQKMVANKASRLFAAYFSSLRKQAHKNGRAAFARSLDQRGPYNFETAALNQLAQRSDNQET